MVPAARRSPCLPSAVNGLLTTVSSPWAQVIGPITGAMRAAGHELWLSGGAPGSSCPATGPRRYAIWI